MNRPWKAALIGASSGFLGALLTLMIQCGGSPEPESAPPPSPLAGMERRLNGGNRTRNIILLDIALSLREIADKCDPEGAR